MTSVTTGNTLVNTDGISITGGPNNTVNLTNTGLDNGGYTIINVAAGVGDTDAVNKGQLDTALVNSSCKCTKQGMVKNFSRSLVV